MPALFTRDLVNLKNMKEATRQDPTLQLLRGNQLSGSWEQRVDVTQRDCERILFGTTTKKTYAFGAELAE